MKFYFQLVCCILLIILLDYQRISAQQMSKTKEFSFNLDAVEGFKGSSFSYKKQAKNNDFWRLKYRLSGSSGTTYPQKDKFKSLSSKIGIGYERRYTLSGNAVMGAGIEPYFIFDWDNQKINNEVSASLNWGTGVGFPFSVILNAKAKWFVGFETTPFFGLNRTAKDDLNLYSSQGFSEFGFDGISVIFGLRVPGKIKPEKPVQIN